jgi:hypothetical protein
MQIVVTGGPQLNLNPANRDDIDLFQFRQHSEKLNRIAFRRIKNAAMQ